MWFNKSNSVQLLPLTWAGVLKVVMGLGEVPQLEVDQACEEREAALDRKLKDWERQLVKAYLTNRKLKELSPEERLSIPDFDKVISFRLVSLQSLNFPWKR